MPFVERLGDALHRLRAGRCAADIDVMRRVDHVAEHVRTLEYRHHHVEVRVMATAQMQVVGDDRVARRPTAPTERSRATFLTTYGMAPRCPG